MALIRVSFLSFVAVAFCLSCAAPDSKPPPELDVSIHHVPEVVYTAIQGVHYPAGETPKGAHAESQKLTWLFHLVFESNEAEPLRVIRVDAAFGRGEETIWEQSYRRSYMERTEWIAGTFDDTTEYFMDNIEFRDNQMVSLEEPVEAELPPGEAVSWVRIPLAAPWFADIDHIQLTFWLEGEGGLSGLARHGVPVVNPQQDVTLRLPFDGTWAVNAGNDLTTGHRRTGLNSLTMYGWDFTKLGPNGLPYKTDGTTASDYWCYDEPVYAAGDGVVVDVRNDILNYGLGTTPPREVLENDGDVFAGNLVTIDHGNGEFSLTSHMRTGSIPVKVGDEIQAGDVIGRTGNSGTGHYPHIHFNLMAGASWLDAKGVPALFSDFERIRMAGDPMPIELGNPMTYWLVRPLK